MARAITHEEHYGIASESEKPLLPIGCEQEVTKELLRFTRDTDTECDEYFEQRSWPFWETLWLSDVESMRLLHPYTDQAQVEIDFDDAEDEDRSELEPGRAETHMLIGKLIEGEPHVVAKKEELWGNGPNFHLVRGDNDASWRGREATKMDGQMEMSGEVRYPFSSSI